MKRLVNCTEVTAQLTLTPLCWSPEEAAKKKRLEEKGKNDWYMACLVESLRCKTVANDLLLHVEEEGRGGGGGGCKCYSICAC